VEILYPNPGFPIYESVIRFSGATPVPIPLHEAAGFSFSADEVLEKITPRTRLIIINSPANPTGGVVPRGEPDRLVAGLERPARAGPSHGEVVCRAARDDRRGVERAARLSLSAAGRRLLHFPQYHRDGIRRARTSRPATGAHRGGNGRRHQLWRVWRGLFAFL